MSTSDSHNALIRPRPLAWLIPAVLVVLAGCRDDALTTSPVPSPELSVSAQAAGVGVDDWIVVFNDRVPDPPGLARGLVAAHGGTISHTYSHALKGFAGTLPPQAIEAIQRNPNVALVERDGVATGSADYSWGLDRIDQRYRPLDLSYTPPGTPPATGAGVTVYVLDTGIDFATYDESDQFQDRLFSGWDFIDNDAEAQDCYGHGTHVAGTVGSTGFGVAKGVDLVSVRVLGCNNSGAWSVILAGIDWVDEHATKPAVANMSLGGSYYSTINSAVSQAVADGITFVVAAGNQNTDACSRSPASTPNAITVGATTSSDARSSFSNYGTCVDLFAPGSAITSTVMGGGSEDWSGTSMATPHVAGVAALWLQANHDWTPSQVWAAIQDAATRDVVSNPGSSSPNLLLYSGTDSGDPCADGGCPGVEVGQVSDVSVATRKNKSSGTVTVTVVDALGGSPFPQPVTVRGSWTVNGSVGFTTSSGVTDADGTVQLSTGSIRNASEFKFCVTGLTGSVDDQTTYTSSSPCSPYPDPGNENVPPTASFTYECTYLSCDFDGGGSSDTDGTIVSYAWNFGDGGTSTGATASHGYSGTGDYTVTLEVTDNDGAKATAEQTVTVTEPPPPDIFLVAQAGSQGPWEVALLTWSGSSAADLYVFRRTGESPASFELIATTSNNGRYNDKVGKSETGAYTYKVCEDDKQAVCSNAETVTFQLP